MSRLWHYKRTEYEGESLWHKGFQRRECLQLSKIGLALFSSRLKLLLYSGDLACYKARII